MTEKQISTGYRVSDATDDGAAYAVAQRVRSDVGALTSANEQLGNVKGCSTTSSALNNISDTMIKARQIMVKLADSTVQGNERTQYQDQYRSMMAKPERLHPGRAIQRQDADRQYKRQLRHVRRSRRHP